MDCVTHSEINQRLCGVVEECHHGFARVGFRATEEMRVDNRGLVHGGFLFGCADYAAMAAVNDPNVVLGSAQTKFLKPVVVGEQLEALATVTDESGKKRTVSVVINHHEDLVFEGIFTCFVLPHHVLDGK